MKIAIRLIPAFFVSLVLTNFAFAQTADEILAKHIAARGGAEKIAAVKSLRLTGSLDLGNGMKATLIQEQMRDSQMRMDMIANMGGGEMRAIRASDGKTGWAFMPQNGDTSPRAMKDDELKDAIEEADFLGPLIDSKKKGHTIELLGREAVDGHDCYKLKVTLKTGESRVHFLDASTFLESRIEGESDGQKFVQTLSNYKTVDGISIPFKLIVEISSPQRPSQKYVYEVEKAEVNPKFDDGHFQMPKDAPTTQPGK